METYWCQLKRTKTVAKIPSAAVKCNEIILRRKNHLKVVIARIPKFKEKPVNQVASNSAKKSPRKRIPQRRSQRGKDDLTRKSLLPSTLTESSIRSEQTAEADDMATRFTIHGNPNPIDEFLESDSSQNLSAKSPKKTSYSPLVPRSSSTPLRERKGKTLDKPNKKRKSNGPFKRSLRSASLGNLSQAPSGSMGNILERVRPLLYDTFQGSQSPPADQPMDPLGEPSSKKARKEKQVCSSSSRGASSNHQQPSTSTGSPMEGPSMIDRNQHDDIDQQPSSITSNSSTKRLSLIDKPRKGTTLTKKARLSGSSSNRTLSPKADSSNAKKKLKSVKTYPIERIVGKKVKNGRTLYFVKWENYPPNKNTWLAKEDFESQIHIENYERRKGNRATTSSSKGSQRPSRSTDQSSAENPSGNVFYKVEKILDRRICNRKLSYLVKWENFDSDSNSWVPADNFDDQALIEEFDNQHEVEPEVYVIEKILEKKLDNEIPLYLVKWENFPESANEWIPIENFESTEMVDDFERKLRIKTRNSLISQRNRMAASRLGSGSSSESTSTSRSRSTSTSGATGSGATSPPDAEEPERYVIEKIIKSKFEDGIPLYLVKWENYPESANEWIPKENFDSPKMVRDFELKLRNKTQKGSSGPSNRLGASRLESGSSIDSTSSETGPDDSEHEVSTVKRNQPSESFNVEKILDKKYGNGNRPFYWVKWENYPESHNQWIPKENFDSEEMINDFERKIWEEGMSGRSLPLSASHSASGSSSNSTSGEPSKTWSLPQVRVGQKLLLPKSSKVSPEETKRSDTPKKRPTMGKRSSSGNTKYEVVEKIVNRKISAGGICYEVKWANFPSTQTSWLRAEDFDSLKMVNDFNRRKDAEERHQELLKAQGQTMSGVETEVVKLITEDGEVRTVEKILRKKIDLGSTKYLVSWKGCGSEKNSWIPASTFTSDSMIRKFEEQEVRRGSRNSSHSSVSSATTSESGARPAAVEIPQVIVSNRVNKPIKIVDQEFVQMDTFYLIQFENEENPRRVSHDDATKNYSHLVKEYLARVRESMMP